MAICVLYVCKDFIFRYSIVVRLDERHNKKNLVFFLNISRIFVFLQFVVCSFWLFFFYSVHLPNDSCQLHLKTQCFRLSQKTTVSIGSVLKWRARSHCQQSSVDSVDSQNWRAISKQSLYY
jgi:hypothetical protein